MNEKEQKLIEEFNVLFGLRTAPPGSQKRKHLGEIESFIRSALSRYKTELLATLEGRLPGKEEDDCFLPPCGGTTTIHADSANLTHTRNCGRNAYRQEVLKVIKEMK